MRPTPERWTDCTQEVYTVLRQRRARARTSTCIRAVMAVSCRENIVFSPLSSLVGKGGESPGMGGNLSCTIVCSQREATEQNVDPKHKIKSRKRAGGGRRNEEVHFRLLLLNFFFFFPSASAVPLLLPPSSLNPTAGPPRCSPIPRKKEGEEEEEGFSIRNGIPPPPPPPLTPPPPPPIGVYNSMRGVL